MHALACRPVSLASPSPLEPAAPRPPRDEGCFKVEHLILRPARKGRVSKDELFAAPLAAGS